MGFLPLEGGGQEGVMFFGICQLLTDKKWLKSGVVLKGII